MHKNMNIVIVENRFMQQSVKSRSVLGNAISTVGKKSILAFWRQIHLKIQCQPHGTWQFSEIQYKSDRGREKKHPAAGQGSTRSQNSRQIEFSSRNGREISSSVYGTTRCPQLYPCPNFLALFLEVHFWSIKRVYFLKNANVLNFLQFFRLLICSILYSIYSILSSKLIFKS